MLQWQIHGHIRVRQLCGDGLVAVLAWDADVHGEGCAVGTRLLQAKLVDAVDVDDLLLVRADGVLQGAALLAQTLAFV